MRQIKLGHRALFVEDGKKTRSAVLKILKDLGYETIDFVCASAALTNLKTICFDFIISNVEFGSVQSAAVQPAMGSRALAGSSHL